MKFKKLERASDYDFFICMTPSQVPFFFKDDRKDVLIGHHIATSYKLNRKSREILNCFFYCQASLASNFRKTNVEEWAIMERETRGRGQRSRLKSIGIR